MAAAYHLLLQLDQSLVGKLPIGFRQGLLVDALVEYLPDCLPWRWLLVTAFNSKQGSILASLAPTLNAANYPVAAKAFVFTQI